MFSSESHVLEVLKMAKKLYEVVNCQSGCCTDCPYRHLSKMERMYLHRILKDQTRWQYLTLPIQHTFSICFSFFLYIINKFGPKKSTFASTGSLVWRYETRTFIRMFQSQIIAMQHESTEGGEAITEPEFCNAVLYAVTDYMQNIVSLSGGENLEILPPKTNAFWFSWVSTVK